jgi:hypothetical protein
LPRENGILGPKGGDRGTGPKGLADECMAKGYEIKVVPAKDQTVAKDVYLPSQTEAVPRHTKIPDSREPKYLTFDVGNGLIVCIMVVRAVIC